MRLSKFLCSLALISPIFAADLTEQYKPIADKLIDAALADSDGYAKLAYLCDRIGARLSGMPSLDRAIQWSAETMKRDGLSNVRVIPVKVPKWVRGAESAQLLTPEMKPLHMLGLGMSVGTPPGGITSDVVVLEDFDQLDKAGSGGRTREDRSLQSKMGELRSDDGSIPQSRSIAGRGLGSGSAADSFGDAFGHADSSHWNLGLRRGSAEDSLGCVER